jgi:hypothetical protein
MTRVEKALAQLADATRISSPIVSGETIAVRPVTDLLLGGVVALLPDQAAEVLE